MERLNQKNLQGLPTKRSDGTILKNKPTVFYQQTVPMERIEYLPSPTWVSPLTSFYYNNAEVMTLPAAPNPQDQPTFPTERIEYLPLVKQFQEAKNPIISVD